MERPNSPASLTNRLILPPAHPNGGQRIGTAPSVSCIRCKSFIKFFGIRASEVETPRGWPGVGKVLICGHEDRGENITDRKSTRLNSSHQIISYAVFCLKKTTTTFITGRSPHLTLTIA